MDQKHHKALLTIANCPIGLFVIWIKIVIWCTIVHLIYMNEPAMGMAAKFNQSPMINTKDV